MLQPFVLCTSPRFKVRCLSVNAIVLIAHDLYVAPILSIAYTLENRGVRTMVNSACVFYTSVTSSIPTICNFASVV
jgi:hypothetical protein